MITGQLGAWSASLGSLKTQYWLSSKEKSRTLGEEDWKGPRCSQIFKECNVKNLAIRGASWSRSKHCPKKPYEKPSLQNLNWSRVIKTKKACLDDADPNVRDMPHPTDANWGVRSGLVYDIKHRSHARKLTNEQTENQEDEPNRPYWNPQARADNWDHLNCYSSEPETGT